MLTLQSPAKVNIFLRVVGKSPDGRPETVALSQAVDLCDTLHFSIDTKDILECSEVSIPSNYTNSILKAVELFRHKTRKHFRVKITLDKRIPARAGLCGSSSNAATTLWGLNQLTGNPVSTSELKSWSKELVQDAPFFFTSGTTLNRGNYEEDASLKMLPTQPLLIASPEQDLPNIAVYNRLRLDELDSRDIEQIIQEAIEGKPKYFNDLEDAAFAIFPKLALIRQRLLQSGYQHVNMTGAGPSLVCYGSGNPPLFPEDIRLFKALPISRKEGQWY